MKLFFIDNNSDKIYSLIYVFRKKIKYRKTGYSYIFKNIFYNFIFWFLRLFLNKNYHIISLGTYCFARTALTFNKLKPRRKQGEKSCPFDLALYGNFDNILYLLDTEFEEFYTDMYFNNECKSWISKNLSVIMTHDSTLQTFSEFQERYDKRIQNFYKYLSDKKHKYFVIATKLVISSEQIDKLFNILQRYMDINEFDVILINQSNEKNIYTRDNFYVINHDKFFDDYNIISMNWAGEIKRRRSPSAQRIYNNLTFEMIKILSKTNKLKA